MVSDPANPISSMEQVTLVQVQVSLAEIKGILTTSLQDHSRRIADNEKKTDDIRTDLTSVANTTTTHAANISDIRQDVTDIRDKANNSLTKAAVILSPIAAIGALAWNIWRG